MNEIVNFCVCYFVKFFEFVCDFFNRIFKKEDIIYDPDDNSLYSLCLNCDCDYSIGQTECLFCGYSLK